MIDDGYQKHSPQAYGSTTAYHLPDSISVKIAALSDSHGNYPLAIRLLDRLPDISIIAHAGDNIGDADVIEQYLQRQIFKVPGNCDGIPALPQELLLTVSGFRIFLSHGDQYHVKSGLDRLREKALRENARIVIYGHTHVPSIQESDGILFVNPGNLKASSHHQSIAIISIENSSISAELLEVNR